MGGTARFVASGVVGRRLVRNDIRARLGSTGCTCTLNGLYLASGKQHVDNHTRSTTLLPIARATSSIGYSRRTGMAFSTAKSLSARTPRPTPSRPIKRCCSDSAVIDTKPQTRDLCRRRQMHARRDGGAIVGGSDLLSAFAASDCESSLLTFALPMTLSDAYKLSRFGRGYRMCCREAARAAEEASWRPLTVTPAARHPQAVGEFDVDRIRSLPILHPKIHGKPLISWTMRPPRRSRRACSTP